jgi:hypothetical protein
LPSSAHRLFSKTAARTLDQMARALGELLASLVAEWASPGGLSKRALSSSSDNPNLQKELASHKTLTISSKEEKGAYLWRQLMRYATNSN